MTRPGATPQRTSELLRALAQGEGETVRWDTLADHFGRRTFGVLLILSILPSFLPAPIGVGAISGPLIALCGVQMLIGLRRPWLPRALGRRGIARASLARFVDRAAPWLARLERLCRVRAAHLVDGRASHLTGLLLTGHGIAIALPVPFTNYPLGIVLVLVAIALLEQDGLLLAIGWLLMIASIGGIAGVSGALIEVVRGWIA